MIRNNVSLNIVLGAILLLPVLLFSSCNKKESRPMSALEALQARGKNSYMANCTACHNPDPRLAGSIGPEIAGSGLDLITARVLHQGYPPGYKPKRTSRLMAPLPFLANDLPALHAYLNSFSKK